MSNKPVNCRYFYGDYHRGNQREECRLLDANPDNIYPWRRKHCNSCPVPDLILNSNCGDLMLEAKIERRFLRERVDISFALCGRHLIELEDPQYCPECAKEWEHAASA
jgi:hypothetical protein